MKYHTLFLSKIRKNDAKFVVCFSHDWHFMANFVIVRLLVLRALYMYIKDKHLEVGA